MVAKSTRLAIVIAVLAANVSAGRAQDAKPVETYRAAVDTYVKTGDPAVAVKPLLGWSQRDLEAGVKAIVDSADAGLIEAAALLHLEIGAAIVGISTPSAAGYFGLGVDLLGGLAPGARTPARQDETATVRATWLRVAGSAFLSVGDLARSRDFLDRALRVPPRAAATLTMRGMVDETDGAIRDPDELDPITLRTRAGRERQRLLLRAEENYRDALKVDPEYPLAHIRLGRVYLLTGRRKEAEASVMRGLARASEPSHRFFGEMFIGALLQSLKDYAGAKAAFERAVAIGPQSQNAIVALANVELLSGRPDRARQIARRYITTVNPDENWWSFKNPTLDIAGLRWLRQRVLKK